MVQHPIFFLKLIPDSVCRQIKLEKSQWKSKFEKTKYWVYFDYKKLIRIESAMNWNYDKFYCSINLNVDLLNLPKKKTESERHEFTFEPLATTAIWSTRKCKRTSFFRLECNVAIELKLNYFEENDEHQIQHELWILFHDVDNVHYQLILILH